MNMVLIVGILKTILGIAMVYCFYQILMLKK